MNDLKRCPQCFKLPEFKFEKTYYSFTCELHGHMAIGLTEELVLKHWNHYIAFFVFDSAMTAFQGLAA